MKIYKFILAGAALGTGLSMLWNSQKKDNAFYVFGYPTEESTAEIGIAGWKTLAKIEIAPTGMLLGDDTTQDPTLLQQASFHPAGNQELNATCLLGGKTVHAFKEQGGFIARFNAAKDETFLVGTTMNKTTLAAGTVCSITPAP